MSRDPARLRKLTTAQEALIRAATALHDVDLRKCTRDERGEIKAARESVRAASTSVDSAIQLGARPKATS